MVPRTYPLCYQRLVPAVFLPVLYRFFCVFIHACKILAYCTCGFPATLLRFAASCRGFNTAPFPYPRYLPCLPIPAVGLLPLLPNYYYLYYSASWLTCRFPDNLAATYAPRYLTRFPSEPCCAAHAVSPCLCLPDDISGFCTTVLC